MTNYPPPPEHKPAANMSQRGHLFHEIPPNTPGHAPSMPAPSPQVPMSQQPSAPLALPPGHPADQQMTQQQAPAHQNPLTLTDYDVNGQPHQRQAFQPAPGQYQQQPAPAGPNPMEFVQPPQPTQETVQAQPVAPGYQPAPLAQPHMGAQPEPRYPVTLPNGQVVYRTQQELQEGYVEYMERKPELEAARALEQAAQADPEWWNQSVVPRVTGQAPPQAPVVPELPAFPELGDADDPDAQQLRDAVKPLYDAMGAQSQQLAHLAQENQRLRQERLQERHEQEQRGLREDLHAKVASHPLLQGQAPEVIANVAFAAEQSYRTGRHAGATLDDCVNTWAEMTSAPRRQEVQHQYNQMHTRPTGAYVPAGGEMNVPQPAPAPVAFEDGSWEEGLGRALDASEAQFQQQQGEF